MWQHYSFWNFNLKQVISLPIYKESALFYKRRLSTFNLTFYNIGMTKIHCFTWHEGQNKRGSSEISSPIYNVLNYNDKYGINAARVTPDLHGCTGHNKSSLITTMLLFTFISSCNFHSGCFNLSKIRVREIQ